MIHRQFLILIKRVISFTPHFHNVTVFFSFDEENVNTLSVQVRNTGMNLCRMREIINEIKYDVSVSGTEECGTLYNIKIPLSLENQSTSIFKKADMNNLGYKPYYKEIENKLSTYFKEKSTRFNTDKGITGCLFYSRQKFVGILEGEKEIITKLYQKVITDRRHSKVQLLEYGPIGYRQFDQWNTLYLNKDEKEKASLNNKHLINNVIHLTLLAEKTPMAQGYSGKR